MTMFSTRDGSVTLDLVPHVAMAAITEALDAGSWREALLHIRKGWKPGAQGDDPLIDVWLDALEQGTVPYEVGAAYMQHRFNGQAYNYAEALTPCPT